MPLTPTYTKDPQAVLDYSLDWSLWLSDLEAITVAAWSVPAGLTKDSETLDSAIATVWVSGGTAGVDYTITCTVTTDQGRTDQRSLLLRCRDR